MIVLSPGVIVPVWTLLSSPVFVLFTGLIPVAIVVGLSLRG